MLDVDYNDIYYNDNNTDDDHYDIMPNQGAL